MDFNLDYTRYFLWGWHEDGKYQFDTDRLSKELPSKAVIFAPEESEHDSRLVDAIYLYSKLHKSCEITVVIGSSKSDFYAQPIPNNVTVHHWPTYWITDTFYHYRDSLSLVDQGRVDKLYISLNSRAHLHRCMMIDELCHYDLMNYGHISWHEPDKVYDWKYWNPKWLSIDEQYKDPEFRILHSRTIPNEYGSTLFNLVAETSIITPFITEKTITAIMYNKPFIVFGAKGFHKELQNLGFELYDELFDYSFDEIKDTELRLTGIMENISNLKDQNYELLRNTVLAKTQRNHNRLVEIATSKKYIPEFVLSYLCTLNQNPDLVLPRDKWYLSLEKLLVN